jgi:hypothetical protein
MWRPFVDERPLVTRRPFVEEIVEEVEANSGREQNQRPVFRRKLDCLESDRVGGQILIMSLGIWQSQN